MTPQQFLAQVGKSKLAPAYLFLGPEGYYRRLCREALLRAMFPKGASDDSFRTHDLEETPLSTVLDDARCLSLFVSERLIWADSAEAALPRTRASGGDEEDAAPSAGTKTAVTSDLEQYLRRPAEGTVIVFNCRRYDLEGEDKAKAERVKKFYATVPVIVEFPRLSLIEARRLASDLLGAAALKATPQALELLVEATAADSLRLAAEVEKLRLFHGEGATVSEEDVARLAPSARSATVFQLVNALASKRRDQALDLLDTLVGEGEYLPLVLTFLSSLFRMALVAKENRLGTPASIQDYFSSRGIPMWRARAQQVHDTMKAFDLRGLEKALESLFEADQKLRDTRPDDRIIMEQFVLTLTS